MKKLTIDMTLLVLAFQRDNPFWGGDSEVFFDKETREVIWYEPSVWTDQELEKKYRVCKRKKKRYIPIPSPTHGEWHEVFLEFLFSNKLENYYQKSIGRTLGLFDESVRYDWYNFKWNYAENQAREFLLGLGFDLNKFELKC